MKTEIETVLWGPIGRKLVVSSEIVSYLTALNKEILPTATTDDDDDDDKQGDAAYRWLEAMETRAAGLMKAMNTEAEAESSWSLLRFFVDHAVVDDGKLRWPALAAACVRPRGDAAGGYSPSQAFLEKTLLVRKDAPAPAFLRHFNEPVGAYWNVSQVASLTGLFRHTPRFVGTGLSRWVSQLDTRQRIRGAAGLLVGTVNAGTEALLTEYKLTQTHGATLYRQAVRTARQLGSRAASAITSSYRCSTTRRSRSAYCWRGSESLLLALRFLEGRKTEAEAEEHRRARMLLARALDRLPMQAPVIRERDQLPLEILPALWLAQTALRRALALKMKMKMGHRIYGLYILHRLQTRLERLQREAYRRTAVPGVAHHDTGVLKTERYQEDLKDYRRERTYGEASRARTAAVKEAAEAAKVEEDTNYQDTKLPIYGNGVLFSLLEDRLQDNLEYEALFGAIGDWTLVGVTDLKGAFQDWPVAGEDADLSRWDVRGDEHYPSTQEEQLEYLFPDARFTVEGCRLPEFKTMGRIR